MASMQELTESEAEEMLQAFKLFDMNGDGRISAKEFGSVLRALGQNPTETTVKEILKQTDADKSGYIEYEEYKTLVKSHVMSQKDVETRLIEAFRFFDKDNSGSLSVSELKKVLTLSGEKMTKEEVASIFRELDLNKDGKLLYSEVANVLCQKLMLR